MEHIYKKHTLNLSFEFSGFENSVNEKEIDNIINRVQENIYQNKGEFEPFSTNWLFDGNYDLIIHNFGQKDTEQETITNISFIIGFKK